MCCADFNFYINRQGIQGRKGEKGDKGFSPTINVSTDTVDEYKLIIANEDNTFETPNLRGNINVLDNGGTYLRYDKETQQISAQDMDAATASTLGGVRLSTEENITAMSADTVVTPADVADALPIYLQGEGAVSITQDEVTSKTKINVDLSSVNELSTRVSNAEAEIVGIQADVASLDTDVSALKDITTSHTTSISAINDNIANLNANKVAKTDFATTETAGVVKVDGTTIIADENGVISSVGGGVTGDVTSDGDNTFTGNNTFSNTILATGSNALLVDNRTNSWTSPQGVEFTKGNDGISHETNYNFTVADGSGNEYQAPVENVTLAASGDLILKANNNNISSNAILTSTPTIKDGDGNIILSQGNITAGDNITIENTAKGIKINSAASGGAAIDDNNISTTTVYSSDKTVNVATNLVNNAVTNLDQTKQDTLVSGTNIKTINGQSVLGEGDITVGGSTPTNMVTTDTAQTINASKRFYEGLTLGDPNGFRGLLSAGILSLGDGGPANLYLKADSKAPQINFYGALNIGARSSNSSITLNSYYSKLKIAKDTLKFTKQDGTIVDLLAGGNGSSDTSDEYGIRADYAIHHGIIDNPNGIITYSATSKDITVNQGLVLNCAGNGTAKTTIATAIPYTVTSTGAFTLFYADGNLLECGKVDYSTAEPEDNGVGNYQAWFNPDKTANPNQQWQFKSNDTGNVFRYVNSATPIADFVAGETGITSVSYLGYRVTDDDIFITKDKVSNLISSFADGTQTLEIGASGTSYTAPFNGKVVFRGAQNENGGFVSVSCQGVTHNGYSPSGYHSTVAVRVGAGDTFTISYARTTFGTADFLKIVPDKSSL